MAQPTAQTTGCSHHNSKRRYTASAKLLAQKGLSILLDIAGSIPGFGNLFSGTVEGIQALNASYYGTIALASTGNTLLNPSASGAAFTAATVQLLALQLEA